MTYLQIESGSRGFQGGGQGSSNLDIDLSIW